jgi:hypothetical protein
MVPLSKIAWLSDGTAAMQRAVAIAKSHVKARAVDTSDAAHQCMMDWRVQPPQSVLVQPLLHSLQRVLPRPDAAHHLMAERQACSMRHYPTQRMKHDCTTE